MQILASERRHSAKIRFFGVALAVAAAWMGIHLLGRWLLSQLPGATGSSASWECLAALGLMIASVTLLQQSAAGRSLSFDSNRDHLIVKHLRLVGDVQTAFPLAEIVAVRVAPCGKTKAASVEIQTTDSTWRPLFATHSRASAENIVRQIVDIQPTLKKA